MQTTGWLHRWWGLAGLGMALAGAALIARQALEQERAAFETNARIAHRLLSQAVVQHDAILATLTLLQPTPDTPGATPPERRLPALYPRILAVQRRDPGGSWNDPGLAAAEAASRDARQAELAGVDFVAGRYQLVLAAQPTSYALDIDLRAMVPWDEWPMARDTSPVRVRLEHGGQSFEVQPGHIPGATGPGWHLAVHKHLAAASQPFDVVAERQIGWGELPWWRMLAWALAVAALGAALTHLQRQRAERRRAEELLRLGQVARLNTLGELAAGMAHELNQPLTAVLANTQAAQRLLADEPPELDTACDAMAQAAAQARRAADVIGRLRRAVERPHADSATLALTLNDAVRRVLYLLEPECQRRRVTPVLHADAPVRVRADPVALEQIVHNLLMNALQALEQMDSAPRALVVSVSARGSIGELVVSDNGPGIAPEALPRLFEPFFSTREGGLGLGLSLCESLAQSMGGTLAAAAVVPHGAAFTLSLPLEPRA